jgi:hypothetical protein
MAVSLQVISEKIAKDFLQGLPSCRKPTASRDSARITGDGTAWAGVQAYN